MSAYGDSRWHDDCCGDCSSCLHFDNNNERGHPLSKRFVTVGSVRYGVRLGAVSPPPPGAGPRYRSQCCWPSTPVPIPGPVSRIPLLAVSPINSRDIFSCVNRVRMAEDATSELPEQATVRDQLFNSTKTLLKTQLRRRPFARSQVYDRLCECGDGDGADLANTLDRLPRFRFGGNRGTTSKVRERDKRDNEVRLKEFTDRLRKGPVPPPRNKHMPPRTPLETPTSTPPTPPTPATPNPTPQEELCARTVPLRSASFSQVDYSTHDKKYVRRGPPDANILSNDSISGAALTLPRTKTSTVRSLSYNEKPHPPTAKTDPLGAADVNTICEMIYQGCQDDTHLKNQPQPSDSSEPPSICDTSLTECIVRNSAVNTEKDSTNAQEKKRDKSRRRKGMYISQWPNAYQPTGDVIPQFIEDGEFSANIEGPKTAPVTTEIPKLQINSDNSIDIWNTPLEPLSPEDENHAPEWPSPNAHSPGRPTLSNQNSEEKDTLRISRSTQLLRADSLSEGEPDHDRRSEMALVPSDVSDCESRTSVGNDTLSPHIPRRFSKRPLRGPYGQMLEAEMKKPESGKKNQFTTDLKFLEDLSTGSGTCSMVSLSSSSSIGAGDPKPKYVARTRGASNHSLDDSQLKNNLLTPTKHVNKRKVSVDSVASQELDNNKLVVSHQRTTSSPSKLEGFAPTEASNELLEQLLRGSSEQLATEANLQRLNDTRTHVVVELFDTESSYVESLQILVTKYLEPLKSPENAGLLDATLVDEIFFQIPSLLTYHQSFLEELKKRLEQWDSRQKVGDVLIDMFSNSAVIESYTNYVNNWKRAREIYKNAQQSKPAFARFLGAMAREHKGKLALDSLLIKPIQKFPKYELLLQRLIKHTDPTHPDHNLLLTAQREIHDQLLKINCTEREALELEQLREIESLIEGLIDLVSTDRQYLRHDLVSMSAGGSTRKERALFLFSDLLLVTSIKRRSGTIRRPTTGPGGVTSTLEANKYKLLMKIALDDLEIVRAKDESLRQMMLEIENLTEDIAVLNQINELAWSLHCSHSPLDDIVKEMLGNMNKQLLEQQTSDSQLSCLDLTLNTSSALENVSIVFSKPEKRASWEESFNEAKHKLAMSGDRRPYPELVAAVPIRKTRAGLQFTCAAPTIGDNGRDVWVCNSDGYVGQVCVLSIEPEPTVTSCNGVCNARILCVASVPGLSNYSAVPSGSRQPNSQDEKEEHTSIQFDSSSSSEEDERSDQEETESTKRASSMIKAAETASIDSDEADNLQSTMWVGTEDGCIHVYNSSDNIRIKKNKIRLQHGSSILCIIYLDNRVFVSLANGDVVVYDRDSSGAWNTNSPFSVTIGSTTMPASKMLPNSGKMWCSCGNTVKILNTDTLTIENCFAVNTDTNKPITSLVVSGSGVWLALQNSAIIKCFHGISTEFLCEVNVAPAVTKMLTSCDDIIRQHKAACLRVTALLACKDFLWIGTSAGVLLTMPLPHINSTTTKLANIPSVMGVPYGHTGHVRFLTAVEWLTQSTQESPQQRHSYKGLPDQRSNPKNLIISGGDGYEDFRSSNLSEVAGREDSTNHLLLWNI